MRSNELVDFLRSCDETSKLELLEVSAMSDDLIEVIKSRGIDTETCERDFAFFKTVYAPLDKANLNGARIFEKDIAPVLASAVGKPVNIDHIRTYTVGHLLEARIIDNNIVAYGLIYKSNFAEEWEEAQQLFEANKLKTSFEIWCAPDDRTYYEDGTFSLDKPVIAGEGILYRTKPAHEEADILELAKKRMDSSKVSHSVFEEDLVAANMKQSDIITADYRIWEVYEIEKLINSCNCPECDSNYWNVDSINFETQSVNCTCGYCELQVMLNLKPELEFVSAEELVYKKRKELKDSDFALVMKKEDKKIRMFPVYSEGSIKNALDNLSRETVKDNLNKLGVDVKEVIDKVVKQAKKFKMDVVIETYKSNLLTKEELVMEEKIIELEKEIAALKAELEAVNASIAEKDEQIKASEEAKAQLSEEAKAQMEEFQKEAATKIEQAKKDATVVAERKSILGEFASDMSDESILNDDKFEIAKLRMDNANLAKEVEEAKKNVAPETATVRGSVAAKASETSASQRIREEAWGKK